MMKTSLTPNLNPSMSNQVNSSLSLKINEYSQWREKLIGTINEYFDWLKQAELTEAGQEIRLNDITQILKKDQLVLAFLAEFSRGKTETINSLFFSDFNQRLLPSEPGRTTMCPTEIFWDADEEPCIKLLPIETRDNDETISFLKSDPNAWHKIKLDIASPDVMKETLKALVQTREVDLESAKKLGFWNENDPTMKRTLADKGTVDIPLWRHALINYPHPLLKNGLVVIDTPGLNTMGAEPELTLGIIPSAHAVLFLTAMDTGVTKSDMEIWSEYINTRAQHKLVILNKIDVLWDGLESEAEIEALIEKQVQNTATELELDPKNVFAMSAQKALIGKIKNDDALLARSGIGKLEDALANILIDAKHEILGRAVVSECSHMIRSSRKISQMRLKNIKDQIAELRELQNENRDKSREILSNVVAERKRYEASVVTFNQGCDKVKRLGNKMQRHLSIGYLNTILDQTKQQMGDSWTTVGLNKSMRELTRLASNLAEEINQEAVVIKENADALYQLFWSKHGFAKTEAHELDMSVFINSMKALEKSTDEFCNDPVNIFTEKRFLIRKFYTALGAKIQEIFEAAKDYCNQWLNNVIGELQTQINAHKSSLDKRAESLMEANNSVEKLVENLASSEKEFYKFLQQSNQLDAILLKLMRCAKG
jgi:hypothetical protein